MAITNALAVIYQDEWESEYQKISVMPQYVRNITDQLAGGGKTVKVPLLTNNQAVNDYVAHTDMVAAAIPADTEVEVSSDKQKYTRYKVDITEQRYVIPSVMAEAAQHQASEMAEQVDQDLIAAFTDVLGAAGATHTSRVGPSSSGVAGSLISVDNLAMVPGHTDYPAFIENVFQSLAHAAVVADRKRWPDAGRVCQLSPEMLNFAIAAFEAKNLASLSGNQQDQVQDRNQMNMARSWRLVKNVNISFANTVALGGLDDKANPMMFMVQGRGLSWVNPINLAEVRGVPAQFAQEIVNFKAYGAAVTDTTKVLVTTTTIT